MRAAIRSVPIAGLSTGEIASLRNGEEEHQKQNGWTIPATSIATQISSKARASVIGSLQIYHQHAEEIAS